MVFWNMSGQSRTIEEHRTVGPEAGATTQFRAENPVSPELATAMMELAPANPFCTNSYAEVMRADWNPIWLLGSRRGGQLVAGCYGFIRSWPLYRVLLIQSVPDVACDDVFWDGLMRFCSSHRITSLVVNYLASPATHIPPLPGEVERHGGCEYVLDLRNPEWERKLRRDHRHNIRRAIETGVTLRRTTSADACREHVRLMAASRERRRKRGEAINDNLERELSHSILLIENGGGELFQAVAGGKALSSGLVLRAAGGAYYWSSGNSPEGMKCGTSHFLIYSIARLLREESRQVFNLGETEPNSGLSLFKSGFGATPVFLEGATFYFRGDLRRKLTDAARSLRRIGLSLYPHTLHS